MSLCDDRSALAAACRGGRMFMQALGLMLALAGIAPAQDAAGTADAEFDEGPAPPPSQKILLYPVNRIIDFIDIFQFDIGFGFGLHANVHATRAAQLGAGGSALSRLGIDGRQAGFYNEKRSEFSILPFSAESYSRTRTIAGTYRSFDTRTQRDLLYPRNRDYFGLGASLTALIVGVQAELKPSEAADFLAGWAGVDFRHDDIPSRNTRDKIFDWNAGTRNSIRKMVLVSSRLASSPRFGQETGKGIKVYDKQAVGEFYTGLIGRASNRTEDDASEDRIDAGLYDIGFNVHEQLMDKFTTAYQGSMIDCELVRMPFDQKALVEKRIADEHVNRLPDYPKLASDHGANYICDLRLLEWALYRTSPLDGLRVRLNVECKIIRYPENEVIVDVSEPVYQLEKQTDMKIEQFVEENGRQVMIETNQAIDILIARLIDRLLEK